MKYILTVEEYHKLDNKNEGKLKAKQSIINDLCTKVCDLQEVDFHWTDGEKGIWGCIHSKQTEHYCDECPTQEFCTQSKNWSK